jgi:threonine/homoserine/homoserine lactone efflux protein
MTNEISRPHASFMSGEPNHSAKERAVYVAAGLGLAAAGAQPRPNPLLNILALAGGAYLAWSGYQGHCAVKAALVG